MMYFTLLNFNLKVNYVPRTVKKLMGVMIFLVFYFTILLSFGDTILSFIESFVMQNENMFKYNATKITYFYNETSGDIETKKEIETVNYAPLMVFIAHFVIEFVIPFLVPLLWLLGGKW